MEQTQSVFQKVAATIDWSIVTTTVENGCYAVIGIAFAFFAVKVGKRLLSRG